MKDRMKTGGVALVVCLNIGVDPPDVIKISPCARLECWIDPFSMPAQRALDAIGRNLQAQYERWQPRARYKMQLDPTVEDVKKLCTSSRRNAKTERVLFHYNGHGVPKPTVNGEIWVFNKSYTQYIPLSVYELESWLGTPSIYVLDCSAAGTIVNAFCERPEWGHGGSSVPSMKETIILAACGPSEILPQNADLPADIFTSCLTTPIKIALQWFCPRSLLKDTLDKDLVDRIPGRQQDRKTPLGELNWIFTAITDTIAWNVLPRDLFQRLFRQDLLVASLFRNYLLAERIMRATNCTPISHPRLPATHQHHMWHAWDLAAEICLSQLPTLLNDPNAEFQPSPFFTEQLTAFEVWLEHGSEEKKPPEQLPIVLQVLLSQSHRLRALKLLGRFLDMGAWAVDLALSVGIFPYVLKLLQTTATELRQILVFIWTKILALDKSCQVDLVKDGGHIYFIKFLDSREAYGDVRERAMTAFERAMAAFVLAVIADSHPKGQAACIQAGLVGICLVHIQAAPQAEPLLLQWLCLCLGKLWDGARSAQQLALRDQAPLIVAQLLTEPKPEVRASATYTLGTLIHFGPSASEASHHGGSIEEESAEGSVSDQADENSLAEERSIARTLLTVLNDASPLVRMELAVALARLVHSHNRLFCRAAAAYLKPPSSFILTSSASARTLPAHHAFSPQLAFVGGSFLGEQAHGSFQRGLGSLAVKNHPTPSVAVASSSSLTMPVGASPSPAVGPSPFLHDEMPDRGREGRDSSQAPTSARASLADRSTNDSSTGLTDRRLNGRVEEAEKSDEELEDASAKGLADEKKDDEADPHGEVVDAERGADGANGLPAESGRLEDDRAQNEAEDQATYVQCIMAIYTLARDPSPRVAALARQSLRSVGVEPVIKVSPAPGAGLGEQSAPQVQAARSEMPPYPVSMPGLTRSTSWVATSTSGNMGNMWRAATPSPPSSAAAFISAPAGMRRAASSYDFASPAATAGARGAYLANMTSPPPKSKQYSKAALAQAPVDSSVGAGSSTPVQEPPGLPQSTLYSWSCEHFSRPLLELAVDDEGDHRRQERERAALDGISVAHHSVVSKVSDQIASFDTEAEVGSRAVLLHPFVPLVCIADEVECIRIWNYEDGVTMNVFQNQSSPGEGISRLCLLNELDESLLLIASCDGTVRVWKDYSQQDRQRMASAWLAVQGHRPGARGKGAVVDWQQLMGFLYASGEISSIMVWDLHRELLAYNVPTQSDHAVTALSASHVHAGHLVAGCSDGSVRIFDMRARGSPHAQRVVGIDYQPGMDPTRLVSASIGGDIKFLDVRRDGLPYMSLDAHKGNMTALAVHRHANVIASGSAKQYIKVFSTGGEQLSMVRYHNSFLGQRIGPVSSLHFHPYSVLLAAGASDSIVSIYAGESVHPR
eukprot:SM000086S23015  [mRNA]  locus=s86:21057:31095:- [translate_table: standard]